MSDCETDQNLKEKLVKRWRDFNGREIPRPRLRLIYEVLTELAAGGDVQKAVERISSDTN
jgi:hypothetical protein